MSTFLVNLPSLPVFLFTCTGDHRHLHSFPTRRSSDLEHGVDQGDEGQEGDEHGGDVDGQADAVGGAGGGGVDDVGVLIDRKSTRLNSSHLGISYAVFCLKKKKTNTHTNMT